MGYAPKKGPQKQLTKKGHYSRTNPELKENKFFDASSIAYGSFLLMLRELLTQNMKQISLSLSKQFT